MVAKLRRFVADENGATAIEYGLIAALVSVAAVAALQLMGGSLDAMFTAVSGQLDTAVAAGAGAGGDAGAGAGAGGDAGAGAGGDAGAGAGGDAGAGAGGDG